MYRLTPDPDMVVHVESCANIPRGSRQWYEYEAWLLAGNTPTPVPALTFEQVMAAVTPGVQAWMDSVAGQNGYDSVISCASYATSGVTRWRQDAEAIVLWRDAVWQYAYNWKDGLNGQLPGVLPTIEEIIAMLPQPETYGWVVHEGGASTETPPPLEEV